MQRSAFVNLSVSLRPDPAEASALIAKMRYGGVCGIFSGVVCGVVYGIVFRIVIGVVVGLALGASSSNATPPTQTHEKTIPPTTLASPTGSELQFTVLEQRQHDPQVFTQGYVIDGDRIFESSGLYGRSFLRSYSLASLMDPSRPSEERQVSLAKPYFAEGITVFNDTLFLLTWREGKLLHFNPATLLHIKTTDYAGEGWGLTHDGKSLIKSNGSHTLSFHHPTDFRIERTIDVHNKWRKFPKLNELEYAKGAIWANVWGSDIILKISPETGTVLGIANLASLVVLNSSRPQHSVLNGIAYDAKRDGFWVTGKLWPRQYLVQFSDRNSD